MDSCRGDFRCVVLLCLWCVGLSFSYGQSLNHDTIAVSEDSTELSEMLCNVVIRPIPLSIFSSLDQALNPRIESNLNSFASEKGIQIRHYGTGQLSSLSFRGMSAAHTQVSFNGLRINSPDISQVNASILPLTGREDLSFEASHVTAGGMLHIASPQLSQNALRIRQVMGTYRHIAHDIGWDKAYDNGYLSITGGYDFMKNNFRYRVMSLPGQPYERLQDADTRRAFYQAHWKNILWVGGRSDGYLEISSYAQQSDARIPPTVFELRSTESIRELNTGHVAKAKINFYARRSWDIYYEPLLGLRTYQSQFSLFEGSELKENRSQSAQLSNRLELNWRKKLYLSYQGNFYHDRLTTNNYNGSGYRQWEVNESYQVRYHFKPYLKTKLQANLVALENYSPRWLPQGEVSGSVSFGREDTSRYTSPTKPFTLSYSIGYWQSQRWPSLNDRYWINSGNPDLRPEFSQTGELSLAVEHNNRALLQLKTYYSHLTDYILWLPQSTQQWMPENIGEVRSYGGELTLGVRKDFN
ncbi:MAG: outer membrane beta-barrel protein, partial [Bacteroidota bacterium]|nr:outer membrane beta-barrel protein [Bacteroidota bacterium]